MANRADQIRLIKAMQERLNRESRSDLLRFTLATMPTFRPAGFHRRYYQCLTKFATGEIKKLMVFIPPQHGKSEGSTRRLPAFLLGHDPDLKIAVISYNATKARKFNREIQRIIDSEEYSSLFPETFLANSAFGQEESGAWVRNSDECEMVGHRGWFKTVSVGGALTGDPVDVLIMDDIYKDAKSAWSPVVRESVRDWYDTVAETRLHNDSRQLMVITRWHEDDLGGELLRQQGIFSEDNPNGWEVITYPAIKVGRPTDHDERQEGEPLWPERHSLEKLQEIRKRNPTVFESLYQQDPKPNEGLLYDSGFRTYSVRPATLKLKRKAYIDTADTGDDFLCGIVYDETEIANYVLDVIYTQKPMEYTEPATAKMLVKWQVEEAVVESNNGGRGFARAVEKEVRIMGNDRMKFKWFFQKDNKDVRIYVNSAAVQNLTYMPDGWERIFPEFAKAVNGYLKAGKNENDDAPDALTGMVERRRKTSSASVADLMGY